MQFDYIGPPQFDKINSKEKGSIEKQNQGGKLGVAKDVLLSL